MQDHRHDWIPLYSCKDGNPAQVEDIIVEDTTPAKKARKCLECCDLFLNEEELLEHSRQTHPQLRGAHKCPVCEDRFDVIAPLVDHFHQHSASQRVTAVDMKICYKIESVEIILCSICGCQFTTPRACDKHIREQHQERPFVCSVCQLSFRDERLYNAHRARNHRACNGKPLENKD